MSYDYFYLNKEKINMEATILPLLGRPLNNVRDSFLQKDTIKDRWVLFFP